jgi:hypothetical protein
MSKVIEENATVIAENATGMAENVSVKRWRRFGMDRVYVNTADGDRIGWVDLGTGERVIESPAHAHIFERAVGECTRAGRGPQSSPTVAQRSEELEEPPGHTYVSSPPGDPHDPETTAVRPTGDVDDARLDLARNLPGQSARTQAIAAQRKEPVAPWLAQVRGVHTDERAWPKGEKGEELVAQELEMLGTHWRVLHALPNGDKADKGSDIDHLVIGPAGVLSLNAKHHKNAAVWVGCNVVMVEGHRQSYIPNSRHEAQRVGRLLSHTCGVPVVATGVVVPVNARSVTIWEQPDDVYVVNLRRLRQWLLSLPSALDRTRVERIFEAARRSSTWAPR